MNLKISEEEAAHTVETLYGIKGEVQALPGEIDFNFRIDTDGESYLLKVGRPDAKEDYLEFQQAILQHVAHSDTGIISPLPIPDKMGNDISQVKDKSGDIRKVRLLSWVEGRLWSAVNPVSEHLLL